MGVLEGRGQEVEQGLDLGNWVEGGGLARGRAWGAG